MLKSLALLASLTALLLGATPACAAPTLITSSYRLAGEKSELALAGQATLVGGVENDTTNVVRSFIPGAHPKVIARVTLSPESGEFSDSLFFAASSTRIALFDHGRSFEYKGSGEIRYERLESGALGGSLAELPDECELAPGLDSTVPQERGLPAHTILALDGEVIAYDTYGCVVVHDFASGLTRVIKLQAMLDPVPGTWLERLGAETLLRVAGRLVAYRANAVGGGPPASVVVYDIDTGAELYSVPLPADYRVEHDVSPTFDLQADGTLVIADARTCSATVSTIEAPAPRPLGVPACSVQRVVGGRALLIVPGSGRDRVLAWSALASPAVHPIANLGPGARFQPTPGDMDESEVVYGLVGCWAPSIFRAPLADPGAPPAPVKGCPAIVSAHRATLTSKKLVFRLRCPYGCVGDFDANAGTSWQLRREGGGESLINIGLPNISIPPGRSKMIRVLPGKPEEPVLPVHELVCQLKRNPRMRLRLDFYVYTPPAEAFATDLELGTSDRAHSHVVIPIKSKLKAHGCRRGRGR